MKRILLLAAALLLLGGATLHHQHWDVFLWQHWKLNRQTLPEQAISLAGYRVDIEALPLQGVEDDLSALAYNAERNTLFSVLNGEPTLLEISLDGAVLRRVAIKGASDMEGLTHVRGNHYVIAEEQRQQLRLIELPDDATSLDVSNAPLLTIDIDEGNNKALEGLSWDAANQQLLVVRERDPLRVMVVEGFVDSEGSSTAISIRDKPLFDQARLFLADLSSLTTDDLSNHILLLSEETGMVVEYDRSGKPLSALGLRRGFHGLARTIPQAEGLAIDSQRRIYIASEPNLFYRFVPPEQ